MANAILNFHFDYLTPSLTENEVENSTRYVLMFLLPYHKIPLNSSTSVNSVTQHQLHRFSQLIFFEAKETVQM